MNPRNLMRYGPLAAILFLLGTSLPAQDAPANGKAVDQQLFNVLRDVINRGREHYNNGDPAACYYMFQGALQVARSVLTHRPDVQQTITAGLAEAEAQPDMRRRAWVLRNVLDRVRDGIRTETAKVEKIDKPEKIEEKKLPEKIDKPAEASLWDRLGGKAAVEKVVDEFTAMAAEDPKVNFTRDGKIKLEEEQVVALKKNLVAFISQASGGPIKYTGKSMKEAHKDLAITDEEFDASVDVLVKVLEKNEVKEDVIKAVKAAVEGTRKDIVTKKE